MSFDDLPQALEWLDSHIDFEASMPTRRALPTLERMRELVDLLGDPQSAYPSLHITGTNGKGSTAAMATALLGAQGLTVGTYTSPNLSRVNERIARNGQPIDDESFVEVLASLSRIEMMAKERPTRFELLTAAAFAWFADEAVDVAVIEVGLGGSWDSTNVVDAEVAVVTNISYDHTDVLGPTLEDIARDKSGIIKPGSRVVVGETDPSLLRLIRSAAAEAGASQVWVRDEDFGCIANRLAVGGRLIDVRTPGADYRELLVPLHGAHQGDNAACALAAVEAFFGAPLDEGVVEAAFARPRGAGPPRGGRPPSSGGGRRGAQRGRHARAGGFPRRGIRHVGWVHRDRRHALGPRSGGDARTAARRRGSLRSSPVHRTRHAHSLPKWSRRPGPVSEWRWSSRASPAGAVVGRARERQEPTIDWWCAGRSTSSPMHGSCSSGTPPEPLRGSAVVRRSRRSTC